MAHGGEAPPAGDRGASVAQYVGLLLVVGATVAALVAGGVPGVVESATKDAICAVGGTDCETSDPAGSVVARPGESWPHGNAAKPEEPFGWPHGNAAKPEEPPSGQGQRGPVPARGDGPGLWEEFRDDLWNGSPARYVRGVSNALGDEAVGLWQTIKDPTSMVDGFKQIVQDPSTLRQLVWDDETARAWDRGEYGTVVGRLHFNVGSWFVPGVGWATKFGKGSKLGKIGGKTGKRVKVGGTDLKAGPKAKALEAARRTLDNARRNRKASGSFKAGDAAGLVRDFRRLDPAGRTAFLDQLSDAELGDLVRNARGLPDGVAAKTELLEAMSPQAVARADGLNPPFAESGGFTRFNGGLFDRGGPSSGDVSQGRLPNCWCLAGGAGVARQNPQSLQRMIKQNRNGTYTVNLGGQKVTVTPDLPRRGARVPPDGPGWPAIMEKAFAEKYGSYDNLRAGLTDEGLEQITGREAKVHIAGRAPSLPTIEADFARGDAFVVGFRSGDSSKNILSGHAYWVEQVDPTKGTITLKQPDGALRRTAVVTESDLKRFGAEISQVPTR